MKDQNKIQESYHVKETIEILFDQIKTGQEFAIAGKYCFTDCQISDTGIS